MLLGAKRGTGPDYTHGLYMHIASSAASGATQPRITSTRVRFSGVHSTIVKGPPIQGGPCHAHGVEYSLTLLLRTMHASGRCNLSNA